MTSWRSSGEWAWATLGADAPNAEEGNARRRSAGAARADQLVERPRDAQHLIDRPRGALDHDDEEVAGDARPLGLGRDGRDGEAPWRIGVREADHVHACAVGGEREHLRGVAI